MESPKFITCPECNERYNDTNKRRLIDTCGHPRCYSCLFKDNPCPVCSKLPHRRERARTLSNEKLLEGINGETTGQPRHQRYLSDTATFSGMFRKDSYLRTLYSYDPASKEYNMEEKMRRYRSLEILNDRTRKGSSCSDTTDQTSISSSTDELDEGSAQSPTPEHDKPVQTKLRPKAWPSCPELSIHENIWQMRPGLERRKRPNSLYQMKHSTNSPRSSVYSPRSSGYWSELEQLSESDSFVGTVVKPSTETSPLLIDKTKIDTLDMDDSATTPTNSQSTTQTTADIQAMSRDKTDINANGIKTVNAWQITRGVLQQWKANRTRSTECLRQPIEDPLRPRFQRVHSMPVECHTKKLAENNVQRKAYMTDV